MATPTKLEIVEKARELFLKDSMLHGCGQAITPEIEELREDGYLATARQILMCANPHVIEVEKKAKSQVEDLTENEDLENFPIELILKEGAFVVGSRGCGKTNLLKLLVSESLKHKVQVKVFDPSLAWKGFPLPQIRDGYSRWNCVYDLSRLSVLEARKFTAKMLANDLEEAIALTDVGKTPKCLVVIEEAQNVLPSNTLRLLKFQDVSRFVSQGRNFGLSYVATTQRLARVDIDLVEISGVKYWFKLEGHRNATKARWWLGKYHTWNLRNLEVGECYLQIGDNVKLLKLPLFEAVKVACQ
jgi:hypothetical protein